MIIQPKEKAWGADYLRFGVALASDFQGDHAFNALVQYRKTWLNRLGGEWTTQAQIGQNTHVWTEFYQPLNEARSYQRLEGNARGIHSWGPHTLNVAISGGTALGSDMPAYEPFTLGGPLRLSGYRVNPFSGREWAFGRLMY